MKNRTRRTAEQAIGNLYKRLECDLATCWYCGDPRDVLDHCPPISVAFKLGLKVIKARQVKLHLIPACNTYNSLLGSRLAATPIERLLTLYGIYQKKLEPRKQWTKDEIQELGRGLRSSIEAYATVSNNLMRKLRGVELRLSTLVED
jgi:hypothetical protein